MRVMSFSMKGTFVDMWICLATVCLMLAWNTASSSKVQTTHGPIEGMTLRVLNGKKVDAFLGVPFAAPPTGRNRFLSPQPMEPWTKTLHVKKLPASCLQSVTDDIRKTAWWMPDHNENEDCLYLNVWRPKGRAKMPIMIWIHGGGFNSGSPNIPLYDGSVLASENDVIVATLSYRLGMFGFMYLNNSEVTGNAGLQDQIKAIEWIRNNAVAFGGDPNRITLFGQSSGSVSVNAHLYNRNISDLFRNGIMESSVMTWPPATLSTSEALRLSLTLSGRAHCPGEDLDAILSCLRSKPASDLQIPVEGLLSSKREVYGPVRNGIEVPQDTALSIPTQERKNVLLGNVPRELAFSAPLIFPNKTFTDNFTITPEEMSALIKNLFHLRDAGLQNELIQGCRYPEDNYNPNNLRLEAMNAISDPVVLCPELDFSKHWVSKTNRVFYYFFKYDPSKHVMKDIPKWLGTIHGDELPFLFGVPLYQRMGYTKEDVRMSKTVMKLWTNFAKNGDPNSLDTVLDGIYWPTLKPGGNVVHLEFQKRLKIKFSLAESECNFWDNVYPQLLGIQHQLDQQANHSQH